MQSCGFVAIFVLASFAIVSGAETTTILPMAVTTMADVNVTSTTAKENSTATSEQMNNDAPQAASVPSVEPTRITEKSTTKQPPLVHTSPPETTPSAVGVSSSLDGSTNANIKTKGNGAFRASTGVAVIGSMILASLVLV